MALSIALLTYSTLPARADGGIGGDGGCGSLPGGAGGTGYTGSPGGNGGAGSGCGSGGGGGAAGGGAGGLGGTGSGFAGGNGGAGGFNGVINNSIANGSPLSGGAGGAGGNGSGASGYSGGGGGGAGGYGAIVTGSGTSSNASSITGGIGGAGGVGQKSGHTGPGGYYNLPIPLGGGGGVGGSGGAGVRFTAPGASFTNSGTVTGGTGGVGGAGAYYSGFNGLAGAGIVGTAVTITNSGSITGGGSGFANPGIVGSSLTIINSGSISGGLYFSGGAFRANAITFTGGTNTLTLQGSNWSLLGNIEIDGNGSIDFNQTTDQALGNIIAGNGSIIQNGPGTLTLSGANTYTGGTIVNAGTLQGTTISLKGNITDNSNLTFNQSNNGTFAGVISGPGSVTLAGSGMVVFNGINTYAGGTNLNAGTLQVGDAAHSGASLAGAVAVAPGATLSGYGTIGGTVVNSGTVTPGGGGIGTLTVGNYTQAANGALQIEVSPITASKLNVTGTANLSGVLVLSFDPGAYSKSVYDIVHAGSITGTFSGLSGNIPRGVVEALSYTPTDVDLVLDPTAAFFPALRTAALLRAQHANAMILGHVAGLESGAETIRTAVAASASSLLASAATQDFAGVPDPAKTGGWFRAVGDVASLNGTSAAPGFKTRTGGLITGFDRAVTDNLILGVAGGFSRTTLSQSSGGTGSIETPSVALYGSYKLGVLDFDATAGYAYDHMHAARPAQNAESSSSHEGHEFTAALQADASLSGNGLIFTPAAGVQYVRLFENAFSESGSPLLDLSVSSRSSSSLQPFIGVSAAKSFITGGGMLLIPEIDISYAYEAANPVPALVQTAGTNFTINGPAPGRDRLSAGGGFTGMLNNRIGFFVDYHAIVPIRDLLEQSVSAGLTYKF